jgi:multidrug resistance protein
MLKKLLVLIVTAFVDMVGLLMVIPLMPYYARDLGAGSLMVTVMVVSFTAAQLLSAPLWGRFSDKYGRRPALLVGLGAAAIAYVVFAYANSIWLLLLSRVVQGAGGGTVGVIQAYVADSTEPENRAKALGWLSAATNLGVALGPPLGSVALLMGMPDRALLRLRFASST